jgi:hypothetical protein
MVWA